MKQTLILLSLSYWTIQLVVAQNCDLAGEANRWDPQFAYPGVKSGTVFAMEAGKDGYLYLGGIYTAQYGGDLEHNNLVRYDGIKYEELGGGLQCTSCGTGTIYAMTQDEDGNIYIGGFFQRAVQEDGSVIQTRNVAKWNIQTESWESLGIGLGINRVESLTWHNDTLFAGGEFTEAYNLTDTLTVNRIAYFLPDSNKWFAMGTGVLTSNGSVNTLQAGKDGTIYIGGVMDNVDGVGVNGAARWTRLGGWNNWGGGLTRNTNIPGTVHELAYDPLTDDVYAVGFFGAFSGSSGINDLRGFAKWDATAQSWSLIPGFGKAQTITAWTFNALYLDTTDRTLYIGGNFFTYPSQFSFNIPVADRIVAYDLTNGTYTDMDQGIQNGVGPYDITRFQHKIFTSGSFDEFVGRNSHNLAAYDGSQWVNLGKGISSNGGAINNLATYGDTIIAGGNFSEIAGQTSMRLARFDNQQGWQPIDLGVFGASISNGQSIVNGIEVIGDELWVGGQFAGVGNSIPSVGIGRVNLQTGAVAGLGTGLAGGGTPKVTEITAFQGDIYIAGTFTSVDGVSADRLARYRNGVWESIGSLTGSSSHQINAFYNDGDSVLYIGGRFSEIDSNPILSGIVAYDGNQFAPLGLGVTGFNNRVTAITKDHNGLLHVGGFISEVTQVDSTALPLANTNLIQWYQGRWLDSTQLDITSGALRINALVVDSQNTLYFAGNFIGYNGLPDSHIGRWNPASGYLGFGGGVTQVGTGVSSYPVMDLALTDSFLYLGGKMSRVGLFQAQGFARYRLEESLPNGLTLDLGPDIQVCDSVWLESKVGDRFLWNTGDTTAMLRVAQSGTFILEIFDRFGCSAIDSIQVDITRARAAVFNADTLSFAGMDTTIDLPADLLQVTWNDGDNALSKIIEDSGTYTVNFVDTNGCTGSDTLYLVQSIGTHTELLKPSEFAVFPNPTTDQLTIEVPGANSLALVLMTVSGKEMHRATHLSNRTTLSLSDLSPGLYLVHISTDTGHKWVKVIKQ